MRCNWSFGKRKGRTSSKDSKLSTSGFLESMIRTIDAIIASYDSKPYKLSTLSFSLQKQVYTFMLNLQYILYNIQIFYIYIIIKNKRDDYKMDTV